MTTASGLNDPVSVTDNATTAPGGGEPSVQTAAASEPEIYPANQSGEFQDMLTPQYYNAGAADPFREEVDKFIYFARLEQFHHPLQDDFGQIPAYSIPANGAFGAVKGTTRSLQYHPASDLHVGLNETDVNIYAAYDGYVETFKDAEKYRHYISLTKDVTDDDGNLLGKLVTIYGHVDLDLDEADSLFLDGQSVSQGDLISKHLYAGTVGGPHLHFEIRYYRLGDAGDESFYGWHLGPNGDPALTDPSSGPWSFGSWHPEIGYGYADPRNHGLS